MIDTTDHIHNAAFVALSVSGSAVWCIACNRLMISLIRCYALGMPTALLSLSSNKVWLCMLAIGHLKAKARFVSIVM